MKKISPENERFWLIQLWLHIHNLIDEYIEFEVLECGWDGVPVRASYISDILRQVFPGEKFWFTGGELLRVWQYEKEHPEVREKCEQYLKSQGIKHVFP